MKQMDYHRRKVQTSTTIGLEYLQPSPFYFKTCKNAPLPPVLQRQDRVPASAHFSLTSHSEHDRKPLNGPLYNEICSKAPPHWTTHFLNELAQRLRDHPTVRVISNPISEMQHQYRGQLAASEPLGEHYSKIQGLYRQLETTQAFVQEPVRSTTKTDFKRFHRSDLSSRSVLDAATFNGKLTKSGAHSRLPAHKAPSTLSCQPRLPRPPLPLPHRGKSTLYMDSFTVPVPPPTSQAADFAQSGGKWEEDDGGRGLFLDVLGVPKMYSTENQTYGTNKTSMV